MYADQYACFALKSESRSAADIAHAIGMEPDEVTVRGSRLPEVPVPRTHIWSVVCRDRSLCVNEQLDELLDRLEPFADRIGVLTAAAGEDEPEVAATLEVVRNFATDPPADGKPVEHDGLGWYLDRRILDFLLRTGAILDVDEYGR